MNKTHFSSRTGVLLRLVHGSKRFFVASILFAWMTSLLDLINGLDLQVGGDKDVFGRVYEYCLRQFALKEGKGKGEFYTPRTVVALLCELI
jgi:hypothetical protein